MTHATMIINCISFIWYHAWHKYKFQTKQFWKQQFSDKRWKVVTSTFNLLIANITMHTPPFSNMRSIELAAFPNQHITMVCHSSLIIFFIQLWNNKFILFFCYKILVCKQAGHWLICVRSKCNRLCAKDANEFTKHLWIILTFWSLKNCMLQ